MKLEGDTAVARSQPMRRTEKFRRLARKFYGQRYLQVMALLGVAWMIVFNYIPMYGIIIAFKDFNIIKSISAAAGEGNIGHMIEQVKISKSIFLTD